DAISLYGTVGPRNGAFSVQLDGLSATTYQGSRTTYTPQTLLFYASNLGFTTHTLLITNTENNANLDIDYAHVHRLDGSSSSSTATVIEPADATNSVVSGDGGGKVSLTSGAIAGIVGGVLTLVGLAVGLCFLLRVNKSFLQRFRRGHRVQSQLTSFTLDSPSNLESDAFTSTTLEFSRSAFTASTTPDSEGFYRVASDIKTLSPREMTSNLSTRDSRELLLMTPAPAARPLSILSNQSSAGSTASTLVAEDGSMISGRWRRFRPRFKGSNAPTQPATSNSALPQRSPPLVIPPAPTIPAPLPPAMHPDHRMSTIPSMPDLLDLHSSILSEANSDINVPIISPSSSPTMLSVSAPASSDGHGLDWIEFDRVRPVSLATASSTLSGGEDHRRSIQFPQIPSPVASSISLGRDRASRPIVMAGLISCPKPNMQMEIKRPDQLSPDYSQNRIQEVIENVP
ncbi:hypothetical protein H0H93_013728, partial [Arthromyces matolae]